MIPAFIIVPFASKSFWALLWETIKMACDPFFLEGAIGAIIVIAIIWYIFNIFFDYFDKRTKGDHFWYGGWW